MHWMQTPSVALVSLRQVFKPLSLPFGQLKSSHFCNQQKIAIHLSFTTYEMRRQHCKALLELTFCEWNFQKILFTGAEQSPFSSSGTAVRPSRGLSVVPVSQGRGVSWLLISLKESNRSLRLEPS